MAKIIITDKSNNVITNIVDTASTVENGLLVKEGDQEYILGFYKPDLYNKFDNITVPDGVTIQKNCFDGTDFTTNPNYVEYKTADEKIAELQNALIGAQNAINSLMEV